MVTSVTPLRIVFFGTPEFAVPTLQALHNSRHNIVGVVTQPDRARGRGQRSTPSAVKQAASQLALPVLQPERLREESFLHMLRGLDADLGVVAAYGKILTDSVLAIPARGLINVHASLLPKYRGAAPIHRAVIAGEVETGITIMRVVKALDAGPMILKAVRPIGPDETSVQVEKDLARTGAALLIEAVDAIAQGAARETPQDDTQATYAPKIEKSDGIVEWTASAIHIHNLIRGLYPWPHAFSDLGGERAILLKSRVEERPPQGWDAGEAQAGRPGTILRVRGEALEVRTGNGVIQLLELQREGRRPVTGRELLAGRRITPGAAFVRARL